MRPRRAASLANKAAHREAREAELAELRAARQPAPPAAPQDLPRGSQELPGGSPARRRAISHPPTRPAVRGLRPFVEDWLDPVALFRRGTGFEPEPWQPAYLREWRNAVVLKGRQVGASTCAGILAIRLARLVPNFTAGIVSPSLYQSKEVKDRAKQALERLGERLTADSAREVAIGNGSRIVSLPGSKKSVRGYTFGLLVIDEAAFMDPETFLAARATAATGGRIIVQSTPTGPFGHFYDIWEHPDPSWAKFHVSSEDVSTIDGSFLAKERDDMTDEEYAQEYLGRFSQAGLGLVDPERLAGLTIKPPEEAAAASESPWARAR